MFGHFRYDNGQISALVCINGVVKVVNNVFVVANIVVCIVSTINILS